MIQAGRYQGIELDPNQFRQTPGETTPSAAALSLWAQDAGMWSRAVRIRWRHLLRLNDSGPVVLLFTDGTAGLLTGANAAQMVVYLKDPYAPAGTASVAGGRAAAVASLGRGGGAAARQPRLLGGGCTVQLALAHRPGAAGTNARCATSDSLR